MKPSQWQKTDGCCQAECPHLIMGGEHVDERGSLHFVNDFGFGNVGRAYVIQPKESMQQRGWVGHRHEHKWFWVLQGSIVIAVVKPDTWDRPNPDLPVERFRLSSDTSQVLHIPSGYATGSVSLSDDVILMVFSSGTIEEAAQDDYRFPVHTWSILDQG